MQCSAVIPDASRHLSRFGKKKRKKCVRVILFHWELGGRPCGCLFSFSLPAHVYIRSGGLFLFFLCRRRYIWISCVKQLESIYLLEGSLLCRRTTKHFCWCAIDRGSHSELPIESQIETRGSSSTAGKRRLRLKRYYIQLHTLSLYSCEGSFLFTTIWFSFFF
jgi:hypothetical protein